VSNSAWKDPLSNAPAPEVGVLLKTILVQRPPFIAVLNGAVGNNYQCGPNRWPIPDEWLWSWRELGSMPNPLPSPPTKPSGYRDGLFYPPADGQSCWIRRFPEAAPAQSGTWSGAKLGFQLASGVFLPWYSVVAWKPQGAPST
jgi:hypothetical protein